jgi:2-polyprenyl-3-methyl-5-hydroxy-6-metoxy-1,4-benzoquinol methylase
MIKQFLRKQLKIAKGIYFTFLNKKGKKYNDKEWWDKLFYTDGVSDRQTITQRKSPISSKYHYASVELQILKVLYNEELSLNDCTLLDIGSGSGHWIEFYSSLGVNQIIGVDVSKSSIDYLEEKYKDRPDISLYNGKIVECIDEVNTTLNFVNAIGVMFHIVDDSEWKKTIEKISHKLSEGGVFIVGGHFGLLNGINVQFDKDDSINKRLRSKAVWRRTLKNAGFTSVKFLNNPAYLHINDTLPENNILIAIK